MQNSIIISWQQQCAAGVLVVSAACTLVAGDMTDQLI